SARGLYVKKSTQDRHQQPALCLGLEPRALLVAEHVKEERELQVREQLAPIGEAGADRALGGGLVVGVVDQKGAADKVGDRGVRRVLLERSAAEDDAIDPRNETRPQLRHQP